MHCGYAVFTHLEKGLSVAIPVFESHLLLGDSDIHFNALAFLLYCQFCLNPL
jgi:hypothetical protein